jgi:hypothetical protein
LFKLVDVLQPLVKVGQDFRYNRGEIGYFAGMRLARIHRSLESLERNLETLKTLQGRCSIYSEAVRRTFPVGKMNGQADSCWVWNTVIMQDANNKGSFYSYKKGCPFGK